MQQTDVQELLLNIIEQAKKPNTPFTFITTWNEFKFYRQNFRATKLIISTLRATAKRLFKSYCKDIVSTSSDVNKLLAVKQLEDIIAFYERELAVLKQMLDEYDDYLGKGNFLYSFFGGERDTWNIH